MDQAEGTAAADRGDELNASGGWGEQVGMEFTEVGPERVVARIEAQPRHHQPYGILHGGVYCSIVESVASHGAGVLARSKGAGRPSKRELRMLDRWLA